MITAPDVTMGEREEETARGRLLLVRRDHNWTRGFPTRGSLEANGQECIAGKPCRVLCIKQSIKASSPPLSIRRLPGRNLQSGDYIIIWMASTALLLSIAAAVAISFLCRRFIREEQDLIEKVTVRRQQVRRTLTHKYDMSPADVGARSSRPVDSPFLHLFCSIDDTYAICV